MKKILASMILASSFILASLAVTSSGSGVIATDCQVCAYGQPIHFTGTGYPPHQYINVYDLNAPYPYNQPNFGWTVFEDGNFKLTDRDGNITFTMTPGTGHDGDCCPSPGTTYTLCTSDFHTFNTRGINAAVPDGCVTFYVQ